MIVNFYDLADNFTLPPDEAIEFFHAKGLKPTFSYMDMVAEEHDSAFTVAKMMDTDLLATTREKLDSALADGKTLAQFREELVPTLQKAGWWGAQPVTDPVTGATTVGQLGSTSRLETIFRTNLQSAYSVGHWEKIMEQADEAPYLMYDAVDDHRTREEHAAWDGTVLAITDPFWRAWMPPNGYNCRCGAIQMNEKEVSDYGLTPSASPDLKQAPWTNPRTGETRMVPQGLDPQFSHNPGRERLSKLQQLTQEKTGILAPPEQQAIDISSAAIQKAREASKTALINSPAMKKIQRIEKQANTKAKAEKATQAAAQAEIDNAVANKTPYLSTAIKDISKKASAKDMTPKQILDAAKDKAASTQQSVAITKYKADKVKGKQPSASVQAIFDDLDATKKKAISDEIDVKTGNYAAKQQISDYETAAGYSYQKKAIKKLKNQGELDGLEPKQQLSKIDQASAAQKAAEQQAKGLKAYKANLIAGKKPTENQAGAFNALPESQKQAMLNEIDEAKQQASAQKQLAAYEQAAEGKPPTHPQAAGWQAAQQAEGSPVAKVKAYEQAVQEAQQQSDASPAATTAKVVKDDTGGPDMDNLVQTGPKKGSNPGGFYLDQSTGKEWYIKNPSNIDNAKNEVLTGKLYQAAGAEAPDMAVTTLNGKPAIASKIIDGLEKQPSQLIAGKVSNVGEQYAVDAWLANWDVVGMEYDNLLVLNGRAIRVDTGGGLRYRAQGGMKGDAFGDTVGEIESIRDPNMNPQGAETFKFVTDEQIREGVQRVAAIPDETITKLVQQYGPDTLAEQTTLINRLKSRRDDLARRYPPKQPPASAQPKRATVSEAQVQNIREAKVSGYTVRTDAGDIEDHNLMFTHAIDADGNPVTRVTTQLTESGKRKVNASLGGGGPDIGQVRERFSTLVAGVNQQIKAKEQIRLKDMDRLSELETAIDEAQQQLMELGTDEAKAAQQAMTESLNKIKGVISLARKGKPPSSMPTIPFKAIPDVSSNAGGPSMSLVKKWHQPNFPQMFPKNGQPTMTGKTLTMGSSSAENREFSLGNGAKMHLYDTDEIGMDGYVDFTIPGNDAAAASRAMEALEELGIDTTPTTTAQSRALMLDQTAYRRYKGRDNARLEQYQQLEGIDEKAAFISKDAGFDIRETATWERFEDSTAFGHGRKSLLRADMDTEEFRSWADESLLYHNPAGLSKVGKDSVAQDIKNIVGGGGTITSLKDRVRRGLPESDNAAADDFRGGGAASVYTRLTTREHKASGFYWRPHRHMRRTDRVTYNSDKFGDRQTEHANHQDQVSEFRENTKQPGGDETFFKDGLSLFDDLDHIQTDSAGERTEVIAFFRSEGYDRWPDGRNLEEVIL